VIRCSGLTRRFGDRVALQALDLEVERGEVFGLLGPNGAGKSTTLYLLLGLLAPSDGRVEVLGLDPAVEGRRIRRACGVVLESGRLYERLTAEENLELWGRFWGLSPRDRRARMTSLLGEFGLSERGSERVETWSRGMKRRLMIARALMHHPDVLLLDEPTQGLDHAAAVSLWEGLESMMAAFRTTIIVATHNLRDAERVCSRVGILREGRLLACESPETLDRPLEEVYLGLTRDGAVDAV
jgi:ABC-type multidrug transport system ATPase subunit